MPSETLHIRGSRAKNGAAAALLLAGAAWGLGRELDGLDFAIVVFIVVGLFGLFLAYQAVRGLPALMLDEVGFDLTTGLATRHFPWREFRKFRVGSFLGPTVVRFEHNASGRDLMVVNQFVVSTAELRDTLAAWHAKHRGADRDAEP